MKCEDCGKDPRATTDVGVGTGYGKTADGKVICYACCAIRDRKTMIEKGDSRNLPLYLTGSGELTNWPGSLRFKVLRSSTGSHNMAGSRTDVWFSGPDGFLWHGTQYGHYTEVCHCQRTKQRA